MTFLQGGTSVVLAHQIMPPLVDRRSAGPILQTSGLYL